MGVLERIESIIRANLNDLLGKKENPEKILEQLISDMQSELKEARDQMTAAVREGKRIRMLCEENNQLAEKWQKKAVLAVQYDKDDLAREAISRKLAALALAEDYRRECDSHEEVIESLKFALKALEEKIQETRRRKDELIMLRRQAEINRLLRQDKSDKMSVFRRMEDKVNALDEIGIDRLAARQREEELDLELVKLKEKLKTDG